VNFQLNVRGRQQAVLGEQKELVRKVALLLVQHESPLGGWLFPIHRSCGRWWRPFFTTPLVVSEGVTRQRVAGCAKPEFSRFLVGKGGLCFRFSTRLLRRLGQTGKKGLNEHLHQRLSLNCGTMTPGPYFLQNVFQNTAQATGKGVLPSCLCQKPSM
jgi:hypothetical protein